MSPTASRDRTGNPSVAMGEARDRIRALAADDGRFVVVCRRTGASPAPVTGASFATYPTARRARDAASAYRNALREVDPGLPEYDLGVVEAPGGSVEVASVRHRTGDRRANGLPRSRRTVTVAGDGNDEWLRVENGPVVHLQGPESRLDDEVVARQLDATLEP